MPPTERQIYKPQIQDNVPSRLQITALKLMAVSVFLTFLAANLQSMLWITSDWLVSTILPAVVVDLTNNERTDDNIPPLKRNSLLDLAATKKAEHMAKHEYFSHFSPDGVSPWHWFSQVSYQYAHAGENLAVYFTDSREMVDAWMASPTHKANIIDNRFTQIGVGTAKGEYGGYDTVYVVQLFGTPAQGGQFSAPQLSNPEPVASGQLDAVTETNLPVVTEIVEEDVFLEETEPNSRLAIADVVESEEVVPEESTSVAKDEDVDDPVVEKEVTKLSNTDESVVLQDTAQAEVVSVQSSLIATSSGLSAVERPTQGNVSEPQSSVLGIAATSPQLIIQIAYSLLSFLIVGLLGYSVSTEWKRHHLKQVAYGFLLCVVMLGLLGIHILVTNSGIVV